MLKLALILFGLQVAVLLLVRPLVWWYWGIDRVIWTLESIDESLRTLPSVRNYDSKSGRHPPLAA